MCDLNNSGFFPLFKLDQERIKSTQVFVCKLSEFSHTRNEQFASALAVLKSGIHSYKLRKKARINS